MAGALSTYSGKRFYNGKEVKHERYWSLMLMNRSPANIEVLIPYVRQRSHILTRSGSLLPIASRLKSDGDHDEHTSPMTSPSKGIGKAETLGERRVLRQIKKIAFEHTFSNMDCMFSFTFNP